MQSLFQKYGGVVGVHDIVAEFYDRLLDDDVLADYFANSNMETLVKHQTNFISSLMGGPGDISDGQLAAAHKGLGIDEESFNRTAGILTDTMLACGVEADDVDTIIGLVAAKAELIIS